MSTRDATRTPVVVRRALLAVLLLGTLGMSADLLLLGHYESLDQRIPLALAALALVTLAWSTLAPSGPALLALRAVMAGFVLAGAVGVVLHFQANAEFQRDIDPALGGFELFWKVVQAKAPPALAPGAMVQLGLLGWLSAYLQSDGRR
jgi:hypothetical protein